MSMNVSINILLVAHPRLNMPQLLGGKFFRQFFHLPLTGLCIEFSSGKKTTGYSPLIFLRGTKTVLLLLIPMCFVHNFIAAALAVQIYC